MFGVWGVAPSGWKVVFTGKGRKGPFRDEHSQASGTGKGVQGPSMDLSPKAEAAGLSQDHSQGQAGIDLAVHPAGGQASSRAWWALRGPSVTPAGPSCYTLLCVGSCGERAEGKGVLGGESSILFRIGPHV